MSNYSFSEIEQFIEENDVKFIRLAFCDIFGTQKNISITPRQLSRAFAEQDSSIAGYLRRRRVALAQSLLIDVRYRDCSVAEIAARCGFASQSTFSRVFREIVGQPPLQWRKANAQQSW